MRYDILLREVYARFCSFLRVEPYSTNPVTEVAVKEFLSELITVVVPLVIKHYDVDHTPLKKALAKLPPKK
jgi:hypothetical protein